MAMKLFGYNDHSAHKKITEMIKTKQLTPNDLDKKGRTIVYLLARVNYTYCIKYMIENGADINTPNKDNIGWTPLHIACYFDYIDCIKQLIQAGANPSIRDYKGRTPIDIAKPESVQFIMMILVESGTDIL
jgi:ankyrin repeat protein